MSKSDRIESFQSWCRSKSEQLRQNKIIADYSGTGLYGRQYWLQLHTANGAGNIVLYESNGYSWVDFEAVNYVVPTAHLFQQFGIEFEKPGELDARYRALIAFISRPE